MEGISGYEVLEAFSSGSGSRVARALRLSDGRPVVLKIPATESLSQRDLLRFAHEYRLLAGCHLPQVVQVLELLPHQGSFVIVEEDFAAESLATFLGDRALAPAAFLPLAIQMAEGLAQVHGRRIVHKDLHLGNVLVEPASGQVKLCDFGHSSLLDQETQEVLSLALIEGNLAFIAPEQTGRTSQGVDQRSDLYSLGVCFYRMLTGQLPFTADDPLALIHAQIARTPSEPRQWVADLPGPLSDLVMRLLAKAPDQRYQSAQGVVHDLKAIQQALSSGESLADFVLCSRDVSTRFRVSHKLYGRQREVDALLAACDRVAAGRPELLLVAGYSGVGKTALVEEVHWGLAGRRGRFVRGKHDQFQRDIPFSALIAALGQLMEQLLAEDETQVARWRQALTLALGENTRVIADVLPELEYLLGPQAPVPELGPLETKHRFLRSFRQFIAVFARPESPLVIFLDDLQWADVPSLQLLELLCGETRGMALLLLGAYRDNEVAAGHALLDTLHRLAEAGSPAQVIPLAPLDLEEAVQLVADSLLQTRPATLELGRLLHEKTGGNPFFLIQTLNRLHAEGQFWQDADSGRWHWDLARVRTLGITDNVAQLMVQRIERLSPRTRQLLQWAACIGSTFSLRTLTAIDQPEHPALDAGDLWQALEQGLILSADGSQFRFLHDRVQQAAYSLIPPDQIPPLQLLIGRLLARQLADADDEASLFAVLGHLNAALALITDPTERLWLAERNAQAGRRAKRATAYAPALHHFATALALLPQDAWTSHYPLALDLHCEALSAAFFTGDHAEMETYCRAVLTHARDLVDTVPVHKARSHVCISQKRNRDGIDGMLPILSQLGVTFPADPGPADIQAALARTRQHLAEFGDPEQLLQLPAMTDRRSLAALDILVNISAPCYMSRPALFPLVVFAQVELSLAQGNAPLSAFGYMTHAMILSGILEDYDLAVRFGQMALTLAHRLDARLLHGKALFLFNNNIRHHKVPLSDTLPDLLESANATLALGDPEYSCQARLAYVKHMVYTGVALDKVDAEMALAVAFMAGVNQEIAERLTRMHWQTVRNLRQTTAAPWMLQGDIYDESTPIPAHEFTTLYVLYAGKTLLAYVFGRYDEAERYAQAAVEALPGAIGLAGVAPLYFLDCLSKMAVLERRDPAGRQRLWTAIDAGQAKLAERARHCPADHGHKWQLVEAERQRLMGQPWQALTHYEQAIAGAWQNGCPHEAALASELAARFLAGQGQRLAARAHLAEAHRAYQRWGAQAKVAALEQEHPELRMPLAGESVGSHSLSQDRLDFQSVLKGAQAISGEIRWDDLLRRVLAVVLENAGAEAGALLVPAGEDWQIAAYGIAGEAGAHLAAGPLTSDGPVCEAVVRFVLRTQKDLMLDDASHDPRFRTTPYVIAHGLRSVICLPLLAQKRLSGILYLENRLTPGAFTPARAGVLKTLAAQAAISLDNALLYQSLEAMVAARTRELAEANTHLQALSLTDGLTGLANRRRFDEVLLGEWRRAVRTRQPLALAMFDADWFKRYNDHYGHQGGDECLRTIARVLTECSRRSGDLAARYGGEEFALIAPTTDMAGIQRVAEEIRQTLAAMAMPHAGSDFGHVTVSSGVAALLPEGDAEPAVLVQQADAALYRAKESGRNRVVG